MRIQQWSNVLGPGKPPRLGRGIDGSIVNNRQTKVGPSHPFAADKFQSPADIDGVRSPYSGCRSAKDAVAVCVVGSGAGVGQGCLQNLDRHGELTGSAGIDDADEAPRCVDEGTS